MGWLDLPYESRALVGDANQLLAETRYSGLDRVVLLGSGETALAAKAIAEADGVNLTVADGMQSAVVDSQAVWFGTDRIPLDRLLVIVSGKHGPSRETDDHRRVLEGAFRDRELSNAEIARHFLVITDPGSPLEQLANRGGYPLVLSEPSIPEGFGALSAYSLIPAALAGADIGKVLTEAAAVRPALSGIADNPGLLLGSILGGTALTAEGLGRDKVAFRYEEPFSSFFEWIEHVVTTSTGKQGRGLLPVNSTGWPMAEPCHDMHSISVDPAETGAMDADTGVTGRLGAQILVWQYAAVVTAWLLGVNPFARPDAGESESNASALLRSAGAGPLPMGTPHFVEGAVEVYLDQPDGDSLLHARNTRSLFDALVRAVPVSGYLSIMSYLDLEPTGPSLQSILASRIFRPVAYGVGPRYVDSTGQYHKGGPGTGAFLVITTGAVHGAPVPGRSYSLGKLRIAQAMGEVQALRRRGRPVVWAHLRDPEEGMAQLRAAAQDVARPEVPLVDLRDDEAS